MTDPIEFAGEPEGQCDCCGKQGYLARVWAYGIETWACEDCRYVEAEHKYRRGE